VRADPVLGATVNVVGTTAVFEAARRNGDQVRGIAYASSGSVYSADDANPSAPLRLDTPIRPPTLYGVFKQANEGTARIYWEDNGLASIGLRPCGIVYGPGRDQGNSSPPSKAMLAAAVVTDYYVPWRGQIVFAHASDVASAFVQAAQAVPAGAQVFNLGGSASSVHDLVAAIEDAEPAMRGRVGIGDARNFSAAFVCLFVTIQERRSSSMPGSMTKGACGSPGQRPIRTLYSSPCWRMARHPIRLRNLLYDRGRPITNRPQVDNLPHRAKLAGVFGESRLLPVCRARRFRRPALHTPDSPPRTRSPGSVRLFERVTCRLVDRVAH